MASMHLVPPWAMLSPFNVLRNGVLHNIYPEGRMNANAGFYYDGWPMVYISVPTSPDNQQYLILTCRPAGK
jgi:hypothetical protein